MVIRFPEQVIQHCKNAITEECKTAFLPKSQEESTPLSAEEISKLQADILKLKQERNAIILVHNYQPKEIQEIADILGDSLGLARAAAKTDAKVILFCGVGFMAETAKIINPGKTVILPDTTAGCSLEACCQTEHLARIKSMYPELYVVSYVNCSSGVKALSDIICTSGNAVDIVKKCPLDREILFGPDQNLGSWVESQTGRKLHLWSGCCYLHSMFSAKDVSKARLEHPLAKVLSHPECPSEVKEYSDEVCSTEKMLHYIKASEAKEFIIVTEVNMLNRLRKEFPQKTFYSLTIQGHQPECKHMKKNTLQKMLSALKTLKPEIILPEEIIQKARIPIERMLS